MLCNKRNPNISEYFDITNCNPDCRYWYRITARKARTTTSVPTSIQNLITPLFSHISMVKKNDSSVSFFVLEGRKKMIFNDLDCTERYFRMLILCIDFSVNVRQCIGREIHSILIYCHQLFITSTSFSALSYAFYFPSDLFLSCSPF